MPRDSLRTCAQEVRAPAAPQASTMRRAPLAPRAPLAMPALAVLLCLLALALSGCGTGAMSAAPGFTHSASGFTLTVLPESFAMGGAASAFRLAVGQEGAQTLVSVEAEQARGLKALYCKLEYDALRLTPLSAGAGDIWPPGGSIQLSVLDRPGSAYFGSVLIHPDLQPGLSGSATLAVFRFRQGAMLLGGPVRTASIPPRTDRSATTVSLDAPAKVLSWGYYNNGDYDQNQLVSLSDLQPIAVHFGEGDGSPFDPASVQSVIDGDINGLITLGDITPIAANFQNHVEAYNVYTSANASDAPSSNGEVSKIAFTAHLGIVQLQGVKTAERLHLPYTFSDIVGDKYYWVRPADGADEGTPSNILHHNEPPPQPPPTLALTNPPALGTGTAADPYIVDTATNYVFSLTDDTDGDVSTNTQSSYTVAPASAGTIANTDATLNIDDAFDGDITVGASYKGVSVAVADQLHLRVPAPSPGQSGTIDIQLPSDSTGTGNLALRLLSPLPADTYFPQGAPVIIFAPDGNVNGAIAATDTWPVGMEKFLFITFVFPGGSQGGFLSDGAYDNRGQACIDALRDVILFATNQKTDDAGKTVQDICEANVLTANVGLLGAGNGGPISLITAKQYGAQFSGLKYVVAWESPSNSQTVCRDAGHTRQGVNFWGSGPMMGAEPTYVFPGYTYATPVLNIDYSQIASAGGQTGNIFRDGNASGAFDVIARPGDGYNTPDVDASGVIEPGEDFCFGFLYSDASKKYYSLEVIQALDANDIFPSWPAWLPTPAEADSFWLLRDAARNFSALAGVRPDLKLLILASNQDHAQAPPDKPHIRQMFDGCSTNSLWVKLNPDAVSAVAVEPRLGNGIDDPPLPTMAPNTAPGNWTVYDYCYPTVVSYPPPEGFTAGEMQAIYEGAGVQEMAVLVN